MDTPELKGGLFGYSRKSVQAVVREHDLEVVFSAQEARNAEARAAELVSHLESTRREASERAELLDRADASAAQLRAELDATEQRRAEADLRNAELEKTIDTLRSELDAGTESSTSTVEGMKEVLEATQRGVIELLEGGRRNAEQAHRAREQAREALRSEIDLLIAWRDKIVPLADGIRHTIDEARTHTTTLAGRLAELADASPPVALVAAPEVIRLEEPVPELEGPERSPWNEAVTRA